MKELQNILDQMRKIESSGAKAVLATVVDVQGSSYRLPGAKMLIRETGETFGTVSGGCLEADVLERAKQVRKTGKAQIITYDTRTNDDSVFALNMGCRGVIRILLERVEKQNVFFKSLELAFEERERQFVAILISTDNPESFPIGGKIFYSQVEQFNFENLPELLQNSRLLIKDCEKFFYQKTASQIRSYEVEGTHFEFFFENINLPPYLLIFGAGADAVPLASLAKNLGWYVAVVDHRAAFAAEEHFPTIDKIFISRPENINLPLDENLVAVVMTHNYEHDKQVLKLLLNSEANYIGALGPKRRTESILLEIMKDANVSDKELQKLYAPVGLDIGADTPESIALSIVAEIQSVLAGRKGGFLRNRQGSIYNRNSI